MSGCGEGCAGGDGVDPVRASGDDAAPGTGEVVGEFGGGVVAVARGGSGSGDRHGSGGGAGEEVEVSGCPESDGAFRAEVVEPGGPFRVRGDEYPVGAVCGAVEGVDHGLFCDGGRERIEGVLDDGGAVGAGETDGGRVRFAGDGQTGQRDACVAFLLVGVGGDAVENLGAHDVCSCEVAKRKEGAGPVTDGDAMAGPCGY